MKIQIKSILGARVVFASDFGEAEATWHGDVPILHEACEVEIDIDAPLAWGREITICPHKEDRIQSHPKAS